MTLHYYVLHYHFSICVQIGKISHVRPTEVMAKLVSLIVLATFVVGAIGQIPGMDFMQQIVDNLGRIQTMNNAMFTEGVRRSQAGRRFGPGETRFRTTDGSGFVYNSPDGSSSSYSFSYGGPSHGFSYSFGPSGTFRREW